MKIIYLHQYFKTPSENGGTRSFDLARSFKEKGLNIVVVSATDNLDYKGKKRWHVEVKDGLEIHRIYIKYSNEQSYPQRVIAFLKFLIFSIFRLFRLKGDVVLATSTPLTIGIPALVKKWFGGTPFVFEVRDVWPEAVIAIGAINSKWMKYVLYKLEKLIYKNASFIVPLSTDMQKSIVSRYPQFKNKTNIVIENIAEINRFQTSDKIKLEDFIGRKPRFSVLYAGTFGKVNGIKKMIELAERTFLLDKDLVYVVVGSGAEKESVIKMAKEKNVFNMNVFILDPISKQELPAWYNAVSMGSSFVIDIPELWANSANKFFDTLAAGKPLLINYEGWQAHTIKASNIGYVLPFEISRQAALDFVKYTHNNELIAYQRKQSLSLAIERYSLEKATARYLTIFEKINSKITK